MTDPTLLNGWARRAPRPSFTLDDVRDRRDRARRLRRVTSAAVGGLVTVALVALAVPGLGRFGTDGSLHSPRGGVGLPPADRPVPAVGPNGYTYVHLRFESQCTIDDSQPDTICLDSDLDLESWWTSDGSGRIETVSKHNYGGFGSGTFGPGGFPTEGDLRAFPIDPEGLRAFLLDRSGPDGASPRPDITPSPGVPLEDGLLWNAIQDYLGDTQYLNATPALRAAMMDVLASIPMVKVDLTAEDPVGRNAIALRFVAYGQDVVVYVDPGTHDFLAMTQRQLDSDYEERVIVLEAGVTQTTHDLPSGEDRSIPAAP